MRKLVWVLLLPLRILVLIPAGILMLIWVGTTPDSKLALVDSIALTWPLRRVEEDKCN